MTFSFVLFLLSSVDKVSRYLQGLIKRLRLAAAKCELENRFLFFCFDCHEQAQVNTKPSIQQDLNEMARTSIQQDNVSSPT